MHKVNHATLAVIRVAEAVTTAVGETLCVVVGNKAVVGIAGPGAGTAVGLTGATADVSMRPPVMVGTAYGGSKRPNRPQALHGYAHELTCFGAARMGSHRESTMVAMAEGSAV